MNVVIGTSIGSATLIYEVIAVFGYLTFGSKVRHLSYLPFLVLTALQVGANIIQMYPSTSLFIAIGQLAIVILVLFSYPLQVHPCRNCLDKVFHPGHVAPKPITASDELSEDDALLEEELNEHESADMTPFKHTLLTFAIISSGFTIAYFVDDLQMGMFLCCSLRTRTNGPSVLSFVGSTGSTTISFILPGLFYWQVRRIAIPDRRS